MDIKQIGEKIKTVRMEKTLTLQAIADRAGIARSTVQRYEHATFAEVSRPVLRAIAAALEVDYTWLTGEQTEPTLFEKIEKLSLENRKKVEKLVEKLSKE